MPQSDDPRTEFTDQDMRDAQPIANAIIDLVTNYRPPAAVAGVALALAATAQLAECDPKVAADLFARYYSDLEAAHKER